MGGAGTLSFRGRLRLFFGLIVVVPMIALAIVLFTLASRSETGKADAGVSAGARTAFALHRESADAAAPRLREVIRDRRLGAALAGGDMRAARARLRRLATGEVAAIALYSLEGKSIARAGSAAAIAARGAEVDADGQTVGTLTVSGTEAEPFVERLRRMTGFDVALLRGGRTLASTVQGAGAGLRGLQAGEPVDAKLAGEEYRGRIERFREPAGPPVSVALLRPSAAISERISDERLLIAILLAAFMAIALASATVVSRALTGQIRTFLGAAHRLSQGDFRHAVPVAGGDEFAELGSEFNSMSRQLESKIEEVERKREELAETIRRVGDALATGLDRDGVVALAVRQAVDACGAEAARALPLAHGAFARYEVGPVTGELEEAIETAERDVFAIRADVGAELLGALEGDDAAERTRRAVAAQAGTAHSLSVGLRSVTDGPEYLGAISIARHGAPFAREAEELLEYLAGQAVVSIENASLHETVERQATTDELTGLANVRAFTSVLDRELERSRRFDTPLGLVMLDLDDFKLVNDTFGHQQGDEVLALVAGVLRDLSRDLDAPARYGGEEMAVVLPQTDTAGAAQLAERMREAVEALQVPRAGGGEALR